MPASTTDWRPTSTIDQLQFRARILRKVRRFFDDHGFFEVQTPCLSHETVVDAHLDPIRVTIGPRDSLYLQTSPEAAMKRLLAAGAHAIYQIGPVFRGDERGPLHNPEFTMLEWYRCGDSMQSGIDLLDRLTMVVTGSGPAQKTTYRRLFQEIIGVDPIRDDTGVLRDRIVRANTGYEVKDSDSRDDLLDVLMALAVQPHLTGTVIVTNFPLSQAALARVSDDDPETAERFELYIDGLEVANGYAELLDADMLVERTRRNNTARIGRGQQPLEMPERLVAAMRHGMPRCSGTAVGLDRLVMAAAGAASIDAVMAFPLERA